MKKAEMKDRIKEAMEIREIKQAELVEKTRIDKGQMSSYLSGKYKPKQRNINLIAQALSVDEAWLMGYDVPMEGCVHGSSEPISPKIMQYYEMLNGIGKDAATEQVRLLTLDEKYTNPDNIIQLKEHPEEAGNAAHQRTDLPASELTPEMQQEDEEIMKNF